MGKKLSYLCFFWCFPPCAGPSKQRYEQKAVISLRFLVFYALFRSVEAKIWAKSCHIFAFSGVFRPAPIRRSKDMSKKSLYLSFSCYFPPCAGLPKQRYEQETLVSLLSLLFSVLLKAACCARLDFAPQKAYRFFGYKYLAFFTTFYVNR